MTRRETIKALEDSVLRLEEICTRISRVIDGETFRTLPPYDQARLRRMLQTNLEALKFCQDLLRSMQPR